jgi:hypothetical protein
MPWMKSITRPCWAGVNETEHGKLNPRAYRFPEVIHSKDRDPTWAGL